VVGSLEVDWRVGCCCDCGRLCGDGGLGCVCGRAGGGSREVGFYVGKQLFVGFFAGFEGLEAGAFEVDGLVAKQALSLLLIRWGHRRLRGRVTDGIEERVR